MLMRKKRNIIVLGILSLLIYITYGMGENNTSNAKDTRNTMNSLDSKKETMTNINDRPVYKIVIDPGHGGEDPGANSTSGQYEKDFTLQLSQKVKELAEKEKQIEIYLTRSDDHTISSIDRERPKYANDLGADLFISIHGNTYTDSSITGTETYYYREESLPFTTIMHRNLVNATGLRDRGVKKEAFFVVKDTMMPAALLEVGYLTNPGEEQRMWTDDFQDRVATSIVEGIKEYLKIN